MDLHGRSVIVTGATGGIGQPLCAALVLSGASVLAVGRNMQRLQALAQAMPHGRLLPLQADLATAQGRQQLLAQVAAQTSPPSMLVIAHAQAAFGLFEQQSAAELEGLLQTNLLSTMLLIHGLLPVLQKQPQAGVAVIGSTFGSLAFPGYAGYSASKFGLRGLVEGLAREYADRNICFQYLSPRATRTEFNSAAVQALNEELGVTCDAPAKVAAELVAAIASGSARLQVGWPERLLARLNGVMPELIDRSLRKRLAIIRRHAGRPGNATLAPASAVEESAHAL